jgi:hypothetical protein
MKLETTKVAFLTLSALFVLTCQSSVGQNVGINSDGSTPGMTLDVKPTGTSDGIRINNANAGAGDPVVNFRMDGTDEFTLGVDDSNGDRFKIDNGGVLTTSPILSIEAGGDVGINTNNPNNTLDVTGNAQVSTYLLVGAPGTPTAIAATKTNLWSTDLNEMDGGLSQDNPCGGSIWQFIYTDPTLKNYIVFDNVGSRSTSNLYTPYIWVPTGSGAVQFMISHETDLENNYDGVYAEVWSGGAWVKLTNTDFVFGQNYPDNAAGNNAACTGNNAQTMWNGTLGFNLTIYSKAGLAGTWTRFRLVGEEDGSVATGTGHRLYHISVDATLPAFGGGFATGNVYAENNVYAGSNVLLGDLAEYFPIAGSAEPGDVISMIDGSGERYMKSVTPYDSKAIGIYSSNPTLTLNDPSSGVPVGLQGRVPVKVTSENGPIKKGDYLTTAFTGGYAMKADKACYIVGRALEDFDGEKGKILCLIETGCYNPVGSVEGSITSGGIFKVPALTESITVVDPSVQKGSRVLVTMLGDPGHRYWVSDVEDGSYMINFSGSNSYAVPFNYLVDNASAEAVNTLQVQAGSAEVIDPIVAGSANDPAAYVWDKATGKCFFNGQEIDPSQVPNFDPPREGRAVNITEETGATPPAVEDETKGFTWSAGTGLVPSKGEDSK